MWAVRCALQPQPAVAEIDRRASGPTSSVGMTTGPAVLAPEHRGQPRAVVVAARRERRGEGGVADELGRVVEEGAGAEGVVGMHVADHHVADRPVGAGADLGAQPGAVGEAAAGVDDEHRVPADHEADVGDAAGVAARSPRRRGRGG